MLSAQCPALPRQVAGCVLACRASSSGTGLSLFVCSALVIAFAWHGPSVNNQAATSMNQGHLRPTYETNHLKDPEMTDPADTTDADGSWTSTRKSLLKRRYASKYQHYSKLSKLTRLSYGSCV